MDFALLITCLQDFITYADDELLTSCYSYRVYFLNAQILIIILGQGRII